jgi:hypothetical protein
MIEGGDGWGATQNHKLALLNSGAGGPSLKSVEFQLLAKPARPFGELRQGYGASQSVFIPSIFLMYQMRDDSGSDPIMPQADGSSSPESLYR